MTGNAGPGPIPGPPNGSGNGPGVLIVGIGGYGGVLIRGGSGGGVMTFGIGGGSHGRGVLTSGNSGGGGVLTKGTIGVVGIFGTLKSGSSSSSIKMPSFGSHLFLTIVISLTFQRAQPSLSVSSKSAYRHSLLSDPLYSPI